MLTQARAQLADHPEIEEVDLVVPPHQVSRMGIGVEETVDEDLPVVGLEQLSGGLLADGTLGRVVYRDSLDLLHHE